VDYSQFVPRGHYTITPSLQRYFRAMMWYSRVAFHLNGPTARAETRQALLLVRAVTMVPGLNALWSAVFDPATAWVGSSDDLTLRDYARVMTAVYGRNAPLSALTNSRTLARFISRANGLPNPQVIADPTQSSASGARATKGMRLFPQRFTPDASIMQGLIWDQVGTAQHQRLWPMGLDVAAALGSSRATSLLTGPLHQNTYARYTHRLSAFRRYYASRPPSSWTQNLYVRWLNTLQSVWSPPPLGAPQFMRTTAWSDKEVATGLGSWAELKHDTILYAKQPAGLGSGGVRPAFRTAYVEPVPAVYAKLSSLVFPRAR
jgi:hypothetical protein